MELAAGRGSGGLELFAQLDATFHAVLVVPFQLVVLPMVKICTPEVYLPDLPAATLRYHEREPTEDDALRSSMY